jgi:hypothetical protein
MADWTFNFIGGGNFNELGIYGRNIFGSPLSEVARISDYYEGANSLIPGVFRVTITSNSTVSVGPKGLPDIGSPACRSSVGVVIDGSTPNRNILSGLSIILSANASVGDIFEVGVGAVYNTESSSISRGTHFGVVVPGVDSTIRTFTAVNSTGFVQCNTRVVVSNLIRVVNTQAAGRPFYSFRQAGELNPTSDDTLSGLVVTFENVQGTPKTTDMKIDGVGVDVVDVATGSLFSGGQYLLCDDTTVFAFVPGGKYQSGEFVLSSNITEGDSATVFVSAGSAGVMLRGDAGLWVDGSSGLILTDDDAPSGVMNVGGGAYFDMKVLPSEGMTSELNPRLFSVRIVSVGL